MNTYWRKLFGWSKTRQGIWETCKRSYYYQYIGKWEGFKGDPQRDHIQMLSRLQRMVFWRGDIIHEIIRNQVTAALQNGLFHEDGAKKYYRQELEKIRKDPSPVITEAFNGVQIEQEKFDELESDGLSQLETFFGAVWPRYRERELVECEQLHSFQVNGTKVWAQIDLVTRDPDGAIRISDWKTGSSRGADSEGDEQMGVYTLWAMDYFNIPADTVSAELVFLRDDETVSIQWDESGLERLKESIILRSREMLSVQSEADFPPDSAERRCVGCNFATICPEGKQFLPGINPD